MVRSDSMVRGNCLRARQLGLAWPASVSSWYTPTSFAILMKSLFLVMNLEITRYSWNRKQTFVNKELHWNCRITNTTKKIHTVHISRLSTVEPQKEHIILTLNYQKCTWTSLRTRKPIEIYLSRLLTPWSRLKCAIL